ncbi:hypothetical protein C8F01DRAFT_626784 [Mycena amicta]|nr:hypothetical protein C8F01DRAFT_626784 [Mycena amicta]
MLSDSQSAVGQPPSSSKVDEDTINEPDPHSRKRFDTRAFLSRLVGAPGIIILGQLVLQGLAWGFYGALWRKGLISVSSFWLVQAFQYKPVAWTSTLASMILAFCSTYLFASAVRQVTTLRLRREGMTFATFLWSAKIASRSYSLDRKQKKWILLSFAVVVLTSVQTPGWNTLLAPTYFSYDTRIAGRELDLGNPLLKSMFSSGVALDSCVFNSSNLVALSVGETTSGFAALNQYLGFPTSSTFMDDAFNTSTAGILPLAFEDVDASPWFGNASDSVTMLRKALSAPSIGFDNGLAFTSTMYQQGFTADVSCKSQDLTSDTTPSLIIDTINGTNSSLPSLVNMSSNCLAPEGSGNLVNITSTYTFLGDGHGYVLMIACGGSDTNYSLIFRGSGLYGFMQTIVCDVAPRIPNVKVDYAVTDDDDDAPTIDTMTLPGGASDIGGPAAIAAVTMIYNMLVFSQALLSNTMGDQVISALTTSYGRMDVLSVMETYVGGVAEYAGTVLRACLSVTNGTFVNGVPENMSIPSNGALHTEFFGWKPSFLTGLALVPGTLVALATIFLVLRAVWGHAVDPLPNQPFDLNNTMHLVSASAAGGLSGIFTGTAEEDIEAASNVHIVVGDFGGPVPAFKLLTQRRTQSDSV